MITHTMPPSVLCVVHGRKSHTARAESDLPPLPTYLLQVLSQKRVSDCFVV